MLSVFFAASALALQLSDKQSSGPGPHCAGLTCPGTLVCAFPFYAHQSEDTCCPICKADKLVTPPIGGNMEAEEKCPGAGVTCLEIKECPPLVTCTRMESKCVAASCCPSCPGQDTGLPPPPPR